MTEPVINSKLIDDLYGRVRSEVSEKRYRHILGVEACAVRIAEYCSDMLDEGDIQLVRVAALLHDVTKDKGDTWQTDYIRENELEVCESERDALPIMHAITGACYVKQNYPEYAHPKVVRAVLDHSTASEGIPLIAKIICLSDYMEEGRRYDVCVSLRNEFFSFDFDNASANEKTVHINKALIRSLENTNEMLIKSNERLSRRTLDAISFLNSEITNITEEDNDGRIV